MLALGEYYWKKPAENKVVVSADKTATENPQRVKVSIVKTIKDNRYRVVNEFLEVTVKTDALGFEHESTKQVRVEHPITLLVNANSDGTKYTVFTQGSYYGLEATFDAATNTMSIKR